MNCLSLIGCCALAELRSVEYRFFANTQNVICNPYRAAVNNQLTEKTQQPTAHCSTFANRTKPTHRPKLAKELQSCQRTQAHPPPTRHKTILLILLVILLDFSCLFQKTNLNLDIICQENKFLCKI